MKVELVTRISSYDSADEFTREPCLALRTDNTYGTTRIFVRTEDGKSHQLGAHTYGTTTATKWIEFIYDN